MMNYLRNNSTGKTYEFDSAPGVQNALMLDYAQPIEIAGFGKGYRVKNDPYTVALNDGRTMQIGIDAEATQAKQAGLQKQALEMEKAQLSNKLLEAQIRAAGQKEGPNWQTIDGADGKFAFNPKTLEVRPLTSPTGETIRKDQPLTEFQGKSAGFGMRAQAASDIIDKVGEGGKVQPSLFKQIAGDGLLGMAANALQSKEAQQVEQAQRDFVNAVLRQESGAAVSESEFQNAKRQYFPQPGDEPEVVNQKKKNRETSIKAFSISAGPGAKNIGAPQADQDKDVLTRFATDQSMRGRRPGKVTPKGIEVFDESGKLIGHYQ